MSRFLNVSAALVGVIAAAQPAMAQQDGKAAKARRLVRKGVQFLGGEKNLKKYDGALIKETGTYFGMGEGLPYTGEYAVQYPEKFRMVIAGVFTQVLNGDKGWLKSGGQVTEMTKPQVKALRDQHYVGWVTQLYPLLDKQFKLELAGTGKVGDQAVSLIKVKSKGHHDVTLAINPKTGALLKVEYRAAMDAMPDKVVSYIGYNDEFKNAGKIKYVSKTRIMRAGKKFIEATITEYKPVEKLDAGLFAKPK